MVGVAAAEMEKDAMESKLNPGVKSESPPKKSFARQKRPEILGGACRSTSAKSADRLSLQERTFPEPIQTDVDFTNTKLYALFIN